MYEKIPSGFPAFLLAITLNGNNIIGFSGLCRPGKRPNREVRPIDEPTDYPASERKDIQAVLESQELSRKPAPAPT